MPCWLLNFSQQIAPNNLDLIYLVVGQSVPVESKLLGHVKGQSTFGSAGTKDLVSNLRKILHSQIWYTKCALFLHKFCQLCTFICQMVLLKVCSLLENCIIIYCYTLSEFLFQVTLQILVFWSLLLLFLILFNVFLKPTLRWFYQGEYSPFHPLPMCLTVTPQIISSGYSGGQSTD